MDDHNETTNLEKTSTPIKIKTIKKHSKIPIEIKKQQQIQRPKVDNIEWNRDDQGIDEIDENQIREISTVNMEDITEPDSQQIQHVTIISQNDDEISDDNELKLLQTSKEIDDELTEENRINSESVCKTFGSSSGSDVALHEAGAELSDDETGT